MASEDRLRELEEKYENYKVYDNQGEKIGKVDDLFVDETDREEYIGVKMGLFGMKSTLIPMQIVRVSESDRTVEVSESKDHVKDAPSFDDDEDITAEYEERIRSHFGLEPAEPPSRAGYGSYSGTETSSREDEELRDHGTGDESTGGEHSPTETEYGERAGSNTEEREPRDVPEYRGGAPTEDQSGTAESQGSTAPSGDETSREVPTSRMTEETETYREGGRTKVRRRIVREEIVEEDPDAL